MKATGLYSRLALGAKLKYLYLGLTHTSASGVYAAVPSTPYYHT